MFFSNWSFKLFRVFIFLFILSYSPLKLFANDTIIIREGESNFDVISKIALFHEPDTHFNISEIRTKETLFQKNSSSNINLGFSKNSHWLKLTVKNESSVDQILVLSISNLFLNIIDFYAFENDELIKTITTGEHRKAKDRESLDRHYTFKVNLKPGASQSIFIFINNHGDSIFIPISLSTIDSYSQRNQQESLFLGLTFGLMLFVFLFNLIYFLTLKDKIHNLYSLYLLCSILVFLNLNGIAPIYLFPNLPWWNDHSTMLFGSILTYFLLAFTSSYLDIKNQRRIYQYSYKTLQVISIAGVIFSFFSNILFFISILIVSVSIPLSFIIILVSSIDLIKKYKSALFFTVAFSIGLFGVFIYFLRDAGFLPSNYLTDNITQICYVLEAMILFFAVLDRNRKIQKESNEKLNEQNIKIIKQSNQLLSTNKELIQNRNRLETLFNTMAEGVFLVNSEGQIILNNKAAEDILGIDRKKISQFNLFKELENYEYNSNESNQNSNITFDKLNDEVISLNNLIASYKKNSKDQKWLSINTRSIDKGEQKKKANETVVTFNDITTRIKIEQEVKQYQEDLKSLTSRLILTEEKHRREIATNLHDHLSQILVLSKIKLDETYTIDDMQDIKENVLEATKYIKQAIINSRELTYDLSPPVLYELGLIEAIHYISEKTTNEHSIEVEFKERGTLPELKEDLKVLVYRSINEILMNVVKHAKASYVEIYMFGKKHELVFMIRDNGKGFHTDALKKHSMKGKGFGLFSIKERLEYLEGRMEIESKPNEGTLVKFLIPIK